MNHLMRHPGSALPNALAAGYAVGGWLLGLAGLLSGHPLLNVLGVPLLAHSLVIAAYLIHECAHNTIFKSNAHNAALGEVLCWLTGAAYGRYEDIRHKHMRHHVDRGDVIAVDFRPLLARRPSLLRMMKALEWAYVPALDLYMHAMVLWLPFRLESRRHLRPRVLAVLAVRAAFFALVAWVSPPALLLYAVAYMIFLHVMRFMDVHQHTYDVLETLERERGPEVERYDRAFEERNTYSNPISLSRPWLNLMMLNFGYHNAHHAKPTAPWYKLPALHRELYGESRERVLPFAALLRSYHRYRVRRILHADAPDIDVGDGRDFVGVLGVSFLTAH